MTVIDVHTHMFTTKWLELLKKEGGSTTSRPGPTGSRRSSAATRRWCCRRRATSTGNCASSTWTRRASTSRSCSLTCPNVYWGGEEVSVRPRARPTTTWPRRKAKYPDRIRWFASLPWEYPQRAVEELERSCAKGAVGVMVLANVAGKSLTDPMFAPIWAAIDKRALPVLVHPTDPPGVDMMDMTKFDLSWSVGFMFDTTLAITRMIFEGFFDQYPNMKVIASHGGGTLPYLVGRFEKGDEVELASRRQMKRKPTDYLRHIYYDSITYDVRSLKYLISIVGADHVMLGTDWPHWVHDTKGAFANTAQLPEGQMKRCGRGMR